MKVYCKYLDIFWSISEEKFPAWGERILLLNTNVKEDELISHMSMLRWRRLYSCPVEKQVEAFGILNFTVMTKKAFAAYIEGFTKRIQET